MYKYYLWVLLFIPAGISTYAQNWVQKADYPHIGVTDKSVSFSIGGKGYVVNYYDIREYDPATNSWTQKTNFPGVNRKAPIGFSIGTKGYCGTGSTSLTNVKLKDFWEYNSITNSWLQKRDFPGAARELAIAFSIGSKGYLGIGAGSAYYLNDFWEYNPVNDTFIQKANFPGDKRWRSACFSIMNKGYIATGEDSTGSKLLIDLWEYNPANNSWTKKANLPASGRRHPIGVGIGAKGYVGTGENGTNWLNDFWEYNPSNNSWTQIANFGGTTRYKAIAFVIGLKMYVGAGEHSTALYDFWEYTQPCTSPSITAQYTNFTKCVGEFNSFSVTTTATTPYNCQWYKDTTAISGATNLSYTLSNLKPSDSGIYRCIISNLCGVDTSADIKLHIIPFPVADFSVSDTAMCLNGNGFKFSNHSTVTSGNLSYEWTLGDGATSTKKDTFHSYVTADTFFVKLKASLRATCYDDTTKRIIVYPQPDLQFTTNDSTQCYNGNNFVFANNSTIKWGTQSFLWDFGDGANSSNLNPLHSYLKADSFLVAFTAISDQSCSDTIQRILKVLPSPVAAFDISDTAQCLNRSFAFNNKSTIPKGSIAQQQWDFGDGQTSTTVNSNHNYLNEGSFKVGLSVTSDQGCMDSIAKNIIAYPMPEASFTLNDSIQCFKGNSFSFTNTSTISSGSLNTLWKLSDGSNSVLNNYQHSFSGSGIFDVKLLSTSGHNCKDSLTQKLYVNDNPVVSLGKDTTLTDKQSITLDAGAGMKDYLWSDGSTKQQLTIDTTGYGIGTHTIWVQVTKNDCNGFDSINITFKKSTGILGSEIENVKVYPNPFSSRIWLDFPVTSSETKIKIVNVLGSEVYNSNISSVNSNSKITIDLSWLTKGLYYLEISDQDHKKIEKLVKE
jgi:N-acetylneuraminic acid mutarotase